MCASGPWAEVMLSVQHLQIMTPKRGSHPLVLFSAQRRRTKRFLSGLEATKFNIIWIVEHEEIAPRVGAWESGVLAEPISGTGAVLLDKITRWQPALIFFDMDHTSLPWREWMSMLKSVPASRRIPVIGFADKCADEVIGIGKRHGADQVVSWREVSTQTASLVQRYARIPDYLAIEAFCKRPLSSYAKQGIEWFNRGNYFEAHEALEEALKHEADAECELYRAILQLAVAYLHIQRRNYRGALKMFIRLRQWLYPLPERCQGVDVAMLRADMARAYNHLLALGPERIGEFDLTLLHPVYLVAE